MSQKLKTYSVLYEVYASTSVDITVPVGTSRDDIIALADKEVCASVCHQCSKEVEISDVGPVLEVLDDHGNDAFPEKKPKAKKGKR